MNERILELAEQAEKLADEETKAFTDDTGQWVLIWNEVYDKKFAELIVRECIKIITQGGYWNHALKGRTPASPSEIAKMVEDYFGIKK